MYRVVMSEDRYLHFFSFPHEPPHMGCQPPAVLSAKLPKFHVPESHMDPRVSGLQYSPDHRRCKRALYLTRRILAVAEEGFTAGQQRFTVRVTKRDMYLHIRVAMAKAPDQHHLWGGPASDCLKVPEVDVRPPNGGNFIH